MKKLSAYMLVLVMALSFAGCGSEKKSKNLEGSMTDLLNQIYETADLEQDFRDVLEFYETTEITSENAGQLIGTDEVSFEEGVYSAPMNTSIAYQLVLLRLKDGEDVNAAMEVIEKNANPRKWVCVEAESVIVNHVGDVILFVMAEKIDADALNTAFTNLAK